jgi:hypothetical protein
VFAIGKTDEEASKDKSHGVFLQPDITPQEFAGKDGIDGTDGADGTHGTNGTHGKNGKDGVNGKHGIDGAAGKAGTDGVDSNSQDGKDGTDGSGGTDGKDGQDGTDGISGAAGKDGKDFRDEYSDDDDGSVEKYIPYVLAGMAGCGICIGLTAFTAVVLAKLRLHSTTPVPQQRYQPSLASVARRSLSKPPQLQRNNNSTCSRSCTNIHPSLPMAVMGSPVHRGLPIVHRI